MDLADQTPEYQAEYRKAAEEIEAAEKSTTPRDPDTGKFVKTEEPVKTEPVKTEPVAEAAPEPTMAELRARLEKAEQIARDNQAWGTRNAQELADIKRKEQEREYAANRPKILDANPELETAVRYVAQRPQEPQQQGFDQIVQSVHPDIATIHVDNPELYQELLARKQAMGPEWDASPLNAIREIAHVKLAFANRQAEKRIAAEVAKARQVSAMSVPGPGTGGARNENSEAAEVARIRSMSNAQFDQERKRVLGY